MGASVDARAGASAGAFEPEHSNFDLLRVFAVTLVIYGNGLVLTGVPATGLWGAPFPRVGVDLLFAISGYLAVGAWARAGGWRPYAVRRALRVMPGLVFCVLATILIIGPIATTLPLRSYVLSSGTRAYLANIVLILKPWLPGTFTGQPWSGAANPMLWTLVPGVLGLATVPPLLAALPGRLRPAVPIAAACVCGAAALALPELAGGRPIVLLRVPLIDILTEAPFFLVGTALAVLERRAPGAPAPGVWRADLAMLCFAATWTMASWLGAWTIVLEWVTLPYMAVCFGRMRVPGAAWWRPLGNPSYGMFLFAFPLQQLVVARLPAAPAPIVIGLVLAFLAGLVSWHAVERPALRRGGAWAWQSGWRPMRGVP